MQTQSCTLTTGPIWKSILLFVLPVMAGNIFQQFYNAFDSWVVGQFLGKSALAAVSSSSSLVFMLVGFFNGVAMGAGVVIARYFGAKDYASMEKAIYTDVAFGLISGTLLSVVGVVMTPLILRWMGTPAEVLPQSIEYFRYYSCGILFTVIYNIFVGILHSVGDSRHPMYYLIFAICLNMVLDLLCVGVFGWGVGSAAMATTISQGVSAVLCLVHLIRVDAPYRIRPSRIRLYPPILKEILRNGIPAGVQNSVIAVANVVVQSSINSFGSAAMAGCGAHAKIEGFVLMPTTSFSQAIATFVSQNIGAKQYRRVKQGAFFGLIAITLLAETLGFICYMLSPHLIGIFNSSPEVLDFGTRHMRTICPFYFVLACTHCSAGIMRGLGKPKVSMFAMIGFWCVLRVTYIRLALQIVNQLETVSWAYPISWMCSSLFLLFYLIRSGLFRNIRDDSLCQFA